MVTKTGASERGQVMADKPLPVRHYCGDAENCPWNASVDESVEINDELMRFTFSLSRRCLEDSLKRQRQMEVTCEVGDYQI